MGVPSHKGNERAGTQMKLIASLAVTVVTYQTWP